MLTEAEESEFWKPPRPHGFDPINLNQFGKQWVNRFMKRQDMSVRRKTNKKKTSVFERMHKIQGYRWYCVYQMAYAPISSEEEESSTSEEEKSSSSEEESDSSTESSSSTDSSSSFESSSSEQSSSAEESNSSEESETS